MSAPTEPLSVPSTFARPPGPPPHLHAPPPRTIVPALPASNSLRLVNTDPGQTPSMARVEEPTTGVCPKLGCGAVCSSPKALERHLKAHHSDQHHRFGRKHGVYGSFGTRGAPLLFSFLSFEA
ncbi:hypothetical protein JCM11251_003159 [Rhodosporidiobolus azoricus]